MFEADEKAWQIIAEHHSRGDHVPTLCLESVMYFAPHREEFLRGLLKQDNLSREHTGFATLALAEMLAHRYEFIEANESRAQSPPTDEFAKYMKLRLAPNWGKELQPQYAAQYKEESIQLFKVVLDRYSDVPCTISMPYFRRIAKLGDKAEKSLHALVHLSIGAEAPDIMGRDLSGNSLKLRDYRGRVVLLSFWFTGCGPCIAMIPKEKELVEKFKHEPFALLAVCADGDPELARKTVEDHGMGWSCLYDGENGLIARDYNVLSWPTFYLLDKNGRIAAKDLDRDHMDVQIAKLLDNN
jgi:thiol-disulfide isomerase/thioredoxin